MAGTYAPGARLPVQTELMSRFGIGSSTVSHALTTLAREGFVTARRGAGAVVTERPPHLHNIIVAVPQRHREGIHWSNYYEAMSRAVTRLRHETNRPIRIIEGFEDLDSPARAELEYLATTHQAAGIVFAYSPHPLAGSRTLAEPGVPRLAVSSTPLSFSGITAIVNLGSQFMEQALACLMGLGRRKIAVISNASIVQGDYENAVRTAIAASGAICPPHWQIPISVGTPITARNVARLLLNSTGAAGRPDGLIIADDNLVEDAAAGILAEAARIPADLEIVAHCNFPWPPFPALPMRRLGPDIGRMLQDCIAVIDACRAGRPTPAVIDIPAEWEADVHGSTEVMSA